MINSITKPVRFSFHFLLILLVSAFLFGCVPPPQQPQPYETATPEINAEPVSGPLKTLHGEARTAMLTGDNSTAINLIQRSINIEPRNPHSWHLLAKAYAGLGRYDECRQMILRSYNYNRDNKVLDEKNQRLWGECQGVGDVSTG